MSTTSLKKFEGKAKAQLVGLPPNATASEMALSSSDQQLVFNVNTDPKTPVGQHGTLFCQVTVMENGEPVIHNIGRGGVLRVDPPRAAKKGEPAKTVAKAPPPGQPAKPLSRLEKLRLEAQQK